MNTHLNQRVKELERQNATDKRDPAEVAEERFRLKVLCTLTPDELQALRDYTDRRLEDPDTQPSPAQRAAQEAYERQYKECKAAGKGRSMAGQLNREDWLAPLDSGRTGDGFSLGSPPGFARRNDDRGAVVIPPSLYEG
jgi:hypothetical protein